MKNWSLCDRLGILLQNILIILQIVIDAINTHCIVYDFIKQKITVTFKMDCPITQSPQLRVVTQLKTPSCVRKPVFGLF